jgi:transposase, IS30 family
MKRHTKFTPAERDLLAKWLAEKVAKSECARRLGRPRRSLLREIKRNSCWLSTRDGQRESVYVALSAQAKAVKRQRHSAHNKYPLKNPHVYAYVTHHLRAGWSPEQISGRLKHQDHPGEPNWQISPETIYAWIYHQPQNGEGRYWWEYLRRKQKRRKRKQGRKVHRGHIPDRTSISKRPVAVNLRLEFGHWEGDSVEGRRQTNSVGLHTEAERISRRGLATKVAALTSKEALRAQRHLFAKEPDCARKSTTLDNGKETHLHAHLRQDFHMMTYHAHPYASYERGTNEHFNWHLRYYFPKGTDFATVSETDLQAVVNEINNRPRKIHHFQSANEVYYQLVRKAQV